VIECISVPLDDRDCEFHSARTQAVIIPNGGPFGETSSLKLKEPVAPYPFTTISVAFTIRVFA